MLHFNAPGLDGPVPAQGRIIEKVTCHGKAVEVQWDDGVALRTQMRFSGVWHLYRPGERWRKPTAQLRGIDRSGQMDRSVLQRSERGDISRR